MEHYFRIAFSMLFLVGHLQANPVGYSGRGMQLIMTDLGINFLTAEVSCGQNVTFTSPTNVKEKCHAAALKCFTEGLENARTICRDEQERINQTLEALEHFQMKSSSDSSQCKWENESSKTFAEFVTDFETLIKYLYSKTQ